MHKVHLRAATACMHLKRVTECCQCQKAEFLLIKTNLKLENKKPLIPEARRRRATACGWCSATRECPCTRSCMRPWCPAMLARRTLGGPVSAAAAAQPQPSSSPACGGGSCNRAPGCAGGAPCPSLAGLAEQHTASRQTLCVCWSRQGTKQDSPEGKMK